MGYVNDYPVKQTLPTKTRKIAIFFMTEFFQRFHCSTYESSTFFASFLLLKLPIRREVKRNSCSFSCCLLLIKINFKKASTIVNMS